MPRLAFTGLAGSGKSTCAKMLTCYKEYSFAEPLKQAVLGIFGIDPKYAYTDKNSIIDPLGVTGRQLLQIVGTELFREDLKKHLPQLKLTGYI